MASRLSQLRKERGITQREIAFQLGITQRYYSMIENGRNPGFQLAKKLADYFGVSVDELFFGDQQNKTFEESA